MAAEYGIIFGARAILSLIGLVTVFIGFWIKERRWDDLGAIAYDKYKASIDGEVPSNDYQAAPDDEQPKQTDISAPYVNVTEKFNFHDGASRDLVRVESSDAKDRFPLPRSLQSEVEGALPVPWVMLIGFALWMLSFFFSPRGGGSTYNSGWNIASVFLVGILATAFGYFLRKATIARKVDTKKKWFIAIFVVTIFLGIAGLADSEMEAPWFFVPFGVILVSGANYTLRHSRKMGINWDYTAQPNQDIVINNGSFVMLIFGIYLLWIGLNAVDIQDYYGVKLPIYTGPRAWFSFISGMGIIVPSLIALEYAFERGSEPVGLKGLNGDSLAHLSQSFTLFDAESLFRAFETPFIFIFGWVLLGFTAFMPFDYFELQQLFVFLVAIAVGAVYSTAVLPAYWNGNLQDYTTFVYFYTTLMATFAGVVGWRGGASLAFSIIGVILILVGQYLDFTEQKRGKVWLHDRKANENLTIFGIGNPVFVVGWIILCHVFSLPMSGY